MSIVLLPFPLNQISCATVLSSTEYLPIGDSKTLLHVVPISRLHEFAMDAKRVGLYARLAICVEVAVDRVASFR